MAEVSRTSLACSGSNIAAPAEGDDGDALSCWQQAITRQRSNNQLHSRTLHSPVPTGHAAVSSSKVLWPRLARRAAIARQEVSPGGLHAVLCPGQALTQHIPRTGQGEVQSLEPLTQ